MKKTGRTGRWEGRKTGRERNNKGGEWGKWEKNRERGEEEREDGVGEELDVTELL